MDLSITTIRTIISPMTIHRIRLSKMQKIVNVLAVSSAVVSLAVVGTVGYVFVNREAIIEDVKEKALGSVLGGVGAGFGAGGAGLGGSLGGDLPTGAPDLSPQTNPDAEPTASAPVQF